MSGDRLEAVTLVLESASGASLPTRTRTNRPAALSFRALLALVGRISLVLFLSHFSFWAVISNMYFCERQESAERGHFGLNPPAAYGSKGTAVDVHLGRKMFPALIFGAFGGGLQ